MLNIQSVRYGSESYSYTSGDKWLYFELGDDAFNEIADEEEQQNISSVDGKLVRCTYGFEYLSKYDRDAKKTDEATQEYLKSMCSKYYKASREQEYTTRKDKGYITYTQDLDSMKPEDYYGLLEKYFTKGTLKYLDGGIVFGYLGHEERTLETDKVICEFLDENPDMKERVNTYFLTSGTGRHYMDNYTSPEDLRKFLEEL